jgi:hypothetical protein
MNGANTTTTPELGDTIRSIVDTVLIDLNVALPAKIVSYNKSKQYADVEIQLLQIMDDDSTLPFPVIPNVPVVWPRANGGKAFVHLPLKAGDDVTLVFSQRSLDNWKAQGGMTNPADIRKHHITDAVAFVGGSALPDAFAPETDDSIEIVNDQAKTIVHPDGTVESKNADIKLVLHPGGKIEVKNSTGELIDILDQITQQVQTGFQTLGTDTVNTIFGPTPLNAFTEYVTIGLQLQSLLTKLESFKV